MSEKPNPYASEEFTEKYLELSKLPEPLRLAIGLEETMQWPLHGEAADCLRKLHEEITALRQALEQAEKQEPVAWKLNVDINNYQGQSEYRTVLAFRPDPAVTGNYEVNEVISAQPLYTSPQPQKPLTDEQIEKMRHQKNISQ